MTVYVWLKGFKRSKSIGVCVNSFGNLWLVKSIITSIKVYIHTTLSVLGLGLGLELKLELRFGVQVLYCLFLFGSIKTRKVSHLPIPYVPIKNDVSMCNVPKGR